MKENYKIEGIFMSDILLPLKCSVCCRREDRIYFMAAIFNGLFYLDTKDLSVHFVHRFSCGEASARGLSSCSMFYAGSVYFFPNRANVIMKYDISKQEEQIIPIQGYSEDFFLTISVIKRGHFAYVFPYFLGKGVYRFDLQKQKVEKDKELSLLFHADSYCANVELVRDNSILLGMDQSDLLMEIDLDAKRIIHSKNLGKGIQIYSIYCEGDECWIISTNMTDIYKWNRKNNAIEVYKNENVVWGGTKGLPYANMIFLEDEILVLNAHLKNILRINEEKKTIEEPIAFPEGFELIQEILPNAPVCGQYTVLKDTVLLYPGRGNMLLIYDKRTRQLTGKEWTISEKEAPCLREALREICMQNKGWQSENKYMRTLRNYVAVVETDKNSVMVSDNAKIGQLIYRQTLN